MKAKFITFVRGLMNGTPPRFQSYLKSLTLLLAMVVSVNVWGATATITTGTYTKQTSTAITEDGSYILLFTGNYILCNSNASSSDYVTQYSYGSAPASITITDDNKQYVWVVQDYNNGQFKLVGPNGEAYSAGNKKMSVVASGSTWQMDNSYIKTTSGLYIKWASSSGFRCYNTSGNKTDLAAVYKLASEKTNVSLNANSNGKADGSVKYTVGNATPDATPSWVTPKDNTGWILNGYYTAASGGTKIITVSNTLVANTTYADASNKWKYKETSLTLYAQWGKTTCETPSNLGQTSVTATSATLTWGTVTGAASYTVYITDADSYEKTIDNITTNSVFLDDLSPNTEYMWKVTAIGDALKGYDDGESNDDGDFTTEAACISPVTINKSDATLPEGCSFSLNKSDGCGDDGGESVEVTCSPATHYTVTAVNSTSGTPGAISNNKCTVSGITANTTISVTFTEDTKYTITFADKLHGESVSAESVYSGETFTFPVIADKTAATSGTCEQVHYHFMGWVLSTHEGTIAAGDIKTGTSAAVTAAATYYAVWAKEEL